MATRRVLTATRITSAPPQPPPTSQYFARVLRELAAAASFFHSRVSETSSQNRKGNERAIDTGPQPYGQAEP